MKLGNVNLSQAQLLLVKAQNDVHSAYAILAETLGVSQRQTFDLAEPAEERRRFCPAWKMRWRRRYRDRPELAAQRCNWMRRSIFPRRSAIWCCRRFPWQAWREKFRSSGGAAAGLRGDWIQHPLRFSTENFLARVTPKRKSCARRGSIVRNEQQGQVIRDVQLAGFPQTRHFKMWR